LPHSVRAWYVQSPPQISPQPIKSTLSPLGSRERHGLEYSTSISLADCSTPTWPPELSSCPNSARSHWSTRRMCASVQRTGSLQRTPLAPQEFLAPLPFQQRGLLQAVGRRGQRGYRPATPGQPAVPGIPAVPGRTPLDPALHFLTLAHIFELECEGPAPWAAIAYLAGALGPVHTQAERNRMGSQAQFVARALAAGAHRHFGTSAGDDHSLASNLRDYLLVLAHALPTEFLSAGVAPLPLRAEFRDAIVYSRDADGRRSIEEARIFSFGNRCSFAELPPRTNLRNTPVPSMPYTLATLCHNPAITLVGLFSLSLAAVCCSPPPLGRTHCSWHPPPTPFATVELVASRRGGTIAAALPAGAAPK